MGDGFMLEENKLLVTNIQRFSLHDGPGIRTTVFLKGCSLRCPWCSNPETQSTSPQVYKTEGIEQCYGQYYSPNELIHECLKDKNYYDGNLVQSQWSINKAEELELLPGGVTFSGGEAILQMPGLVPVCYELHRQSIHIAMETSLFAPSDYIYLAMQNIDLFYVDVKILDKHKCHERIKGDVDTFLFNLNLLIDAIQKNGRCKPIVIRIPVIGQGTDDDNNRNQIHDLLKNIKNKILKIELLQEHNLAEHKYAALNMNMSYHGIEDRFMEKYRDELLDLQIPVEILAIN